MRRVKGSKYYLSAIEPTRQYGRQQTMELTCEDELIEVTPKSTRLRKRHLDPNERKKYAMKASVA